MGHPGFMQSMGMPPMNCAPQAQPLPSNVLGKGGDRSMDQQYMQQSSQIYVFSTQWANRSAEAVMQEQYPSIIAWHESQPETKKHLEVSAGFRGTSMVGTFFVAQYTKTGEIYRMIPK
jgi:hypothetical protein